MNWGNVGLGLFIVLIFPVWGLIALAGFLCAVLQNIGAWARDRFFTE